MQPDNVWELLFHGEDLDLLVECNGVDSWDSHALLIVEFVLEVLDVEVLHLSGHHLDLIEQVVVIIIHPDLVIGHHIVQVKLVNLFECEWLYSDQVAVLLMPDGQFFF